MEEFDMDTIFVFAEGVKTREEDFGLLVISKTTTALSLNIDSKFIWNLIDGKRSVAGILSVIEDEYEGENLQRRLVDMLLVFQKLGLIQKA